VVAFPNVISTSVARLKCYKLRLRAEHPKPTPKGPLRTLCCNLFEPGHYPGGLILKWVETEFVGLYQLVDELLLQISAVNEQS